MALNKVIIRDSCLTSFMHLSFGSCDSKITNNLFLAIKEKESIRFCYSNSSNVL